MYRFRASDERRKPSRLLNASPLKRETPYLIVIKLVPVNFHSPLAFSYLLLKSSFQTIVFCQQVLSCELYGEELEIAEDVGLG